ncbi:MAG TPA: hypothetical protein VKP08_03220 [Anaerolineales bacterium]|nr:hypothetical protein [Anaerolineales bacterium]
MKTNGWVASSQRFYRWLLHLYPQGYRSDYEEQMLHLFTDQCREVSKQQGSSGRLFFWLRTAMDLGITVVREHLSDPNAKVGLLEAAPNKPLPWKGVLLVLIPGLIFFISQVEQVTSSNGWFFLAFFRAGYVLMLPVLVAWLVTRRFPIWGLIPLGLLYKTLTSYNPDYLLDRLFGPSQELIMPNRFVLGYLIPVSAYLVLLGGLVWYFARQGQIRRSAWKWLGGYGLLVILPIGYEIYNSIVWLTQSESPAVLWPHLRGQIFTIVLVNLYQSLPFLLLVFIGMLFIRKHGGLTFLLLLGYLFSTILFGRYDPGQLGIPFYLIILALLVYRFVLALVAPLWLVRAASIPEKQHAVIIPVTIAIACSILLSLIALAWGRTDYPSDLLSLAIFNWSHLMFATGSGLAVVLYLQGEKDQKVVSAPDLVATVE